MSDWCLKLGKVCARRPRSGGRSYVRAPIAWTAGLTSIVASKGTIVIDGRICMFLACCLLRYHQAAGAAEAATRLDWKTPSGPAGAAGQRMKVVGLRAG